MNHAHRLDAMFDRADEDRKLAKLGEGRCGHAARENHYASEHPPSNPYCVSPALWKQIVCAMGCVVHDNPDDCEGFIEGHHVVGQQQLRRRGLNGLFWDTRNGVGVCQRAHARHTTAVERICRDRLPQHCFDFADEQGLGWLIERYYPLPVEDEAA